MKFFITSIGTRGDIEPFLAIGELLLKHAHEVVFCFPRQFENLIPKSVPFYPLTSEFLELLESPEGRQVMGKANLIQKAKAVLVLSKKGKAVNKKIINAQHDAIKLENPDCIIHHPKCSYPIFCNLKNNTKHIIVSPVPFVFHPVENHPHIGFPLFYNTIYCKLTYKLAQFAWVNSIFKSQNHLSKFPQYSKKQIYSRLSKSPFIYTISPELFEKANNWPEHIQILGYHERDKITDWLPSSEIKKFLERHSKVLFLTFGSMINHDPEQISKMFYQVISSLKIPCIVNLASGGLLPIDNYKQSGDFLFVEDIPYEWIYKRVYAVIHHGGSGTTHTSLKFGLPQLIIPHIVDQFMWKDLIYQKGLGPKGKSINKVNAESLKERIFDLFHNMKYENNSSKLSAQINSNDMENELYNFIITKVGR